MLVMVGDTRSRRVIARLRQLGWGRVFCRKPTPYPGEPWALDNGAFAAWKGGRPFDAEGFIRRVEQATPLAPLFGVLPDVVGGGESSLALSRSWLPRLPTDFPWYLAVQDGMTGAMVEPLLEQVAGILLGGTTRFKGTAPEWSALAHRRGKRFHYARVSTAEHVRRAVDCEADSCDSSQPLWSEDHWLRFQRAVGDTVAQVPMFQGGQP